MAKTRVKNWTAEILTHTDLNAEFDNLINTPMDLISPAPAAMDMNGQELIMDTDGDSSLTMDTDDTLDVKLKGIDAFIFDGTVASPVNGLTLTSSATGADPDITAHGSDTDIGIKLITKGTGGVTVTTGTTALQATTTTTLTASGLVAANAGITVPTSFDVTLTDAPASGTDAANKTYVDTGDALGLLIAQDLADLNNVSTARTNLGLGTAALVDTGTSLTKVALCDGVNTWAGVQTFSAAPVISSFASATHDHADAAGGGTLGTDSVGTVQLKIATGTFTTPSFFGGNGNVSSFSAPELRVGEFTITPSDAQRGTTRVAWKDHPALSSSPTQGEYLLTSDADGTGGEGTITVTWSYLTTI